MKANHDEIGVGATEDLSLRVSVATLVRVLFEHPRDCRLMLALERKATHHESESGHVVEIKSQPFGGAIRIRDLSLMRDLIGDFHFDSERSRSEQDFRILIRPSDWTEVRKFCIEHFNHVDDPILETNPRRELTEEFADTLTIRLKPDQYLLKPVGMVVENGPAPAKNNYVRGIPTVRVYRVFEARIVDASLAHVMMKKSESISHQDLCELAHADAQSGGNGWANAMLTLPLKQITDVYLRITANQRNTPILYEKNLLDETVSVVLEGISVPKYQWL